MQGRLREIDDERQSLATLKSDLVKESNELKYLHQKEVQRMEQEFAIVRKDLELKHKEELCLEKVNVTKS